MTIETPKMAVSQQELQLDVQDNTVTPGSGVHYPGTPVATMTLVGLLHPQERRWWWRRRLGRTTVLSWAVIALVGGSEEPQVPKNPEKDPPQV
jgi:hypothetical protein